MKKILIGIGILAGLLLVSYGACISWQEKHQKTKSLICGNLIYRLENKIFTVGEKDSLLPFASVPLVRRAVGKVESADCGPYGGYNEVLHLKIFTGGASCCWDNYWFVGSQNKVFIDIGMPFEEGKEVKMPIKKVNFSDAQDFLAESLLAL